MQAIQLDYNLQKTGHFHAK